MASSINASTSGAGGIITTADNTGTVQDRMRIDSSGNVGIGTTSPGAKLEVLNLTSNTNTVADILVLRTETSGTAAAGLGGQVSFVTENSNGIVYQSGFIGCATSSSSAAVKDSYIYFSTSSGSTNPTERMRIDSSGNVNIGQTSAFGAAIRTTIKAADTSSQALALVSAVTSGTGTLQYLVDGSNDVCGYIGINATANTTSYNTSSDYRLKENIIPMTGALDKVSQLKPVVWNWKHAPEVIGQGFIAHELAEVIPDAVSGEKDAVDEEGNPVYQGVDTSFLVATLTAAIKELKAIVDAQQQEINALKGAQ